jgi:hypothetical protein
LHFNFLFSYTDAVGGILFALAGRFLLGAMLLALAACAAVTTILMGDWKTSRDPIGREAISANPLRALLGGFATFDFIEPI